MPNVVRTIRHGSIAINATGASVTLFKVDGGIGDADILSVPVQAIHDRGTVADIIKLDDDLLSVSFALQFTEFLGESAGSTLEPAEILLGLTNNSAVTLTKKDATIDPYNVDIVLTITNPLGSGSEVCTWSTCVPTNVKFSEGYPNRLSFSISAKSFAKTSTLTT